MGVGLSVAAAVGPSAAAAWEEAAAAWEVAAEDGHLAAAATRGHGRRLMAAVCRGTRRSAARVEARPSTADRHLAALPLAQIGHSMTLALQHFSGLLDSSGMYSRMSLSHHMFKLTFAFTCYNQCT